MTESFYTFMGALDALIKFLKPASTLLPAPPPGTVTSQDAHAHLVTLYASLRSKAEDVSDALANLCRERNLLAAQSNFGDVELALEAAHFNPGLMSAVSMVDFEQKPAAKQPLFQALAEAADNTKALLKIFKDNANRLHDAICALENNFPRVDPELKIIMERTKRDIEGSGLTLVGGGGEGGGYWPSTYGGSSSSSSSSSSGHPSG